MYMIIYIQALITIQILYQLKAHPLLHIIIIAIWPYVDSELDWGSTNTIHTAILQLITISM